MSVSTISSRSTSDNFSYLYHQPSPKVLRKDPTNQRLLKHRMSRIRRAYASSDQLAVSLHTCASDYKRRRARPGFDRQQSLSRWVADGDFQHSSELNTPTSHFRNKLRKLRGSASEGSLSSLTSKRPLDIRKIKAQASQLYNCTSQSHKRNVPFRRFSREDSSMSLTKPVRKRSCGPDSLLKDVLLALASPDMVDEVSSHCSGSSRSSNHSSSRMRSLPKKMMLDPTRPDVEDIEEETEHEESDEFRLSNNSNSHKSPVSVTSRQAPLLAGRWSSTSALIGSNSSGSSGDLQPPSQSLHNPNFSMDRLLSRSRCGGGGATAHASSKRMPVIPPPPPPFSPLNSKPSLLEAVTKNATPPSSSPMTTSPLAVASAAIAIATDCIDDISMKDDDDDEDDTNHNPALIEEESEAELNDLVHSSQRVVRRTVSRDPSTHNDEEEGAASESSDTDAATAEDLDPEDTWHDSGISTDNVSLVSLSKDSIFSSTLRSNSTVGPRRTTNDNKQRRRNSLDFSHKSIAEDSCHSFHDDRLETPVRKKRTFTVKNNNSNSNHNNNSEHQNPHRIPLRDASVVPPAMPKRTASNHQAMAIPELVSSASNHSNHSQSSYQSRLKPRNNLQAPAGMMRGRRSSLPEKFVCPSSPLSRSHRHRRASTGEKTSNARAMGYPTPPMTPDRLSPRSRKMKILSLQNSFLTPTMSKTPRQSPAMGSLSRKCLGQSNRSLTTSSHHSTASQHRMTPKNRLVIATAAAVVTPMMMPPPPPPLDRSEHNLRGGGGGGPMD